jgi:hypothetical protein
MLEIVSIVATIIYAIWIGRLVTYSVTGSASTYGNMTRFYAPDGKPIGSATTNGKAR